jgi:5-methylcytosine-specific restriction enzyme A
MGGLIHSRRWNEHSRAFLRRHPLCRYCEELGRLTIATVVDHIVPHKEDRALFWDSDNWQSLCKPCHDSVKQREEKTGARVGCDVAGIPADPQHHWSRAVPIALAAPASDLDSQGDGASIPQGLALATAMVLF